MFNINENKPQSCLGFVFLNTWAYHKSNTVAVLKKTLK